MQSVVHSLTSVEVELKADWDQAISSNPKDESLSLCRGRPTGAIFPLESFRVSAALTFPNRLLTAWHLGGLSCFLGMLYTSAYSLPLASIKLNRREHGRPSVRTLCKMPITAPSSDAWGAAALQGRLAQC